MIRRWITAALDWLVPRRRRRVAREAAWLLEQQTKAVSPASKFNRLRGFWE